MPYSDSAISAPAMSEVILRFAAEARHPGMPSLQVSELADLSSASVLGQGRPGVYLIYRADRTLIYIGMSLSNIGGRLERHMSPTEQASPFWKDRTPALAQTVIVAGPWEAPSLEEYLVHQAKAM